MNKLPKKVELEDGTVVSIDDYCAFHCPQRYESECFVLCWLEQEMEAENGFDDCEDYDDESDSDGYYEWDDDFPA